MTAPLDADRLLGVQSSLMVWLAVHGYLCLALRHPGARARPSAALVEQFVDDLGDVLVETGILTPEQLQEARQLEAEEIDRAARCEVCGCTQSNACEGGCVWVGEMLMQGRYVCTRCYEPNRIITADDPRFRETVRLYGSGT